MALSIGVPGTSIPVATASRRAARLLRSAKAPARPRCIPVEGQDRSQIRNLIALSLRVRISWWGLQAPHAYGQTVRRPSYGQTKESFLDSVQACGALLR